MPKLSIITICYNEPNLEETCKSIVAQTWQNFEWIVIDGASDKETLDVFEKYKYRIDKFVSEPDEGLYNAMNKGMKFAKGEYIHLLNAGDSYYDKDVLLDVFTNFNYKGDFLSGTQCNVDRENKKKRRMLLPPEVFDANFMIRSAPQPSASFIKRELFEKYGLFNENYKIVSDYEKEVEFFKNGVKYERIDRVVSEFDTNGISSNSKTKVLHRKERNEVLKKYFSEEEISAALSGHRDLSMREKSFSIVNSYGKKYKLITILGISFKIKRENK